MKVTEVNTDCIRFSGKVKSAALEAVKRLEENRHEGRNISSGLFSSRL